VTSHSAEEAADVLTRRLLVVAVVAAVIATAVQTVVHLVGLAFFDLEIEVLNADADTSVFAWASIVATFAAAFAALLLAVASWPVRAARYGALAGILAFFSLDDMVQIHERVSRVWRQLGIPEDWHLARLLWPAIFLPLLVLAFVLPWQLGSTARPHARRLVRSGLLLLVGAVALEAASPLLFQFGWDHRTWPHELEVVAEEGAELAGWILVAAGVSAVALRELAASALPSYGAPPRSAPAAPRAGGRPGAPEAARRPRT
jgi:hypothetical protein